MHLTPTGVFRTALIVAATLGCGCSTYQARPLPTAVSLLDHVPDAKPMSSRMPSVSMRTHRFNPTDGFDPVELATLAILNNPDLKLARADAGVSEAQAFQAGLLPDPQIALTTERVLGSPAGFTTAFTSGLTIDFATLLAHGSIAAASDADGRKARLNLLWQEWQIVAQAQVLFAKIVAQEKTLDALRQYQSAFDDRWRRTKEAAERGLLTNDSVTPFLTALQDVNRQVSDVIRQRNQSRHDLAILVGVSLDVELQLVEDGSPAHIDAAPVRAELTQVLLQRPDLAALHAGYEAEDDRYRGALIAQFPGFTFGPTRSRDTSNVNTSGLALGITLPIFNRNRGNIAIEKATREKLRVEFQNRLDATTVEVDRLFAEQDLLERQLEQVDRALNDLVAVDRRAESAFAASNVDALVITNVQTALLAKRVERITTEELLAEQRIALRTLITNDLSASPLASPP